MKLFETLLNIAAWIATYVVVYLYLGLSWVGAEYLFEGAVHSSTVDGYVLALLTFCIVREINRLEKELVGRRNDK